jgi:protein TonB
LLHGLVAAAVVGSAFFFHHRCSNWGENASTAGAIQATMVSSLPLPPTQRTLDTGVLTSEAPSPAPIIAKERTEPPPSPKEIAIPEKIKPPKIAEKTTPAPPKHVQPITPPPTKAVTGETAGIRIAQSTLESKNGTSSVSIQDRSFGDRYAYYVNIVNNKVSQNWYKSEADPLASMDKSTTTASLQIPVWRPAAAPHRLINPPCAPCSVSTASALCPRATTSRSSSPSTSAPNNLPVRYSFDYLPSPSGTPSSLFCV